MKYIILVSNRFDIYNRYWVTRPTLEEARKVAYNYTKDNKFIAEIFELGESLD